MYPTNPISAGSSARHTLVPIFVEAEKCEIKQVINVILQLGILMQCKAITFLTVTF